MSVFDSNCATRQTLYEKGAAVFGALHAASDVFAELGAAK